MRVLFWSELFWPYIGGVEIFCMQLLSALQKKGYQLMVITSHGDRHLPDEDQYQGIPVYRFPFQSALLRFDLRKVNRMREVVSDLKRQFAPDVIHINSIQPGVFFHLQTMKADSSSVLVTVHSPLGAWERNGMIGKVLGSAQWIATVSEAMLSDVARFMPEITPRTSVIYNGLLLPEVQPAPLSFRRPRILCLGRVVAEKGFDVTVRAFCRVADRFPEARLVIAGDGPERANLQQQVAGLGLTQAVDFTGWIPPADIPQLINTATMVVVPSRWREPFGLVALQAAQMARPVVASRVGGLPEIVAHGRTGFLYEKENSRACAGRIAFLLQHPERAVQMGQAARKRSQKLFGMERFVNDYEALYQKLSAP